MKFITYEALRRPEVLRWHERIIERYSPPGGIKLTIILPCSAKKPYSKSRSHRIFREYIRKGAGDKLSMVHEIILTSPLGLVPRELEASYPANCYDIPVTGEWTELEREYCSKLLKDYLSKAKVNAIAHVEGALREICEHENITLTKENIMSKVSLKDLEEKIRETLKDLEYSEVEQDYKIRKICDFQFGKGASKFLFPQNIKMRGNQIFLDNEQVAALNRHGYLSLTLKGGELLRDFGSYLVEISFLPQTNNIFCSGIIKADSVIRPGDEVIVLYNNEVVGVGKAILSGEEMVKAKKGLAIALRHRRKCAR